MYRSILVAFAFSDAGRDALAMAAGLARHHMAKLHIFHALDYKLMNLAPDDDSCELACTEAEERFAREHGDALADVEATFDCRPADPAMEICRLARERKFDLIVMGCHRRKLARIDYTGMTILEKSPCPVLLVPHRDTPAISCADA
jgi:nucleotide-binding universal stress UspA family protein